MPDQTDGTKKLFFLAVVGIIGFVILFCLDSGAPVEPDDTDIAKPTRFLKTVQPLLNEDIKPKDAAQLAAFYKALSHQVAGDTAGKIDTLETLVKVHGTAGVVRFENEDLFLAYQNLRAPVNDVIAAGAGVSKDADGSYPQVDIIASRRAGIAEALMAAAWACEQHTRKKVRAEK
jgi:hypothetical protein